MKILLINANQVVSRLLALCTRDESIELDEVQNADAVNSGEYDIILVDGASYGPDVAELLTLLGKCKKVFISYDNEPVNGFDIIIKKPFLPSQITELIENLEVKEDEIEEQVEAEEENDFLFPLTIEEQEEEKGEEETEEVELERMEMPSIFPLSDNEDTLEEDVEEIAEEEHPTVLDNSEIEKIKELLNMDEEELAMPSETLSDDEYETRKIEVIKEQLIADGLEIVAEEEIVEELHAKSEEKIVKMKKKNKSKNSKDKKAKESKKKKNKDKKKEEVAFTEEELESIEDAIEVAVATMTKKQMKKLLKGEKIEVSIEIEGIQ